MSREGYAQTTTSIKNTSTKTAPCEPASDPNFEQTTSSLKTGTATGKVNEARAGHSGTGHASTLGTGTKN